jgi:hypothetical protein
MRLALVSHVYHWDDESWFDGELASVDLGWSDLTSLIIAISYVSEKLSCGYMRYGLQGLSSSHCWDGTIDAT